LLPPSLEIRTKVERELEAIWQCVTEEEVRSRVEALNAEIAKVNRTSISGPPTSIASIEVEAVVVEWGKRLSKRGSAPGSTVPFSTAGGGRPRHGRAAHQLLLLLSRQPPRQFPAPSPALPAMRQAERKAKWSRRFPSLARCTPGPGPRTTRAPSRR